MKRKQLDYHEGVIFGNWLEHTSYLKMNSLNIHTTSGCTWPKATVKSPVGAVALGHCFLFFLIFYSLFGLFIFGIFFKK